MIEKVFHYSIENNTAVEKIIMDENINYLHMVFNKEEGLPEHYSNSNVYMTVIKGKLSIQLNEQEVHEYVRGDILNIPYNTKMNVKNLHDDVLELIVIKAPAPAHFNK